MKKQLVSLVAVLVIVATASAPAALANDAKMAQTFSLALHCADAVSAPGYPLDVTISLELFGDDTARRRTVIVSTWIETPLGRATLSENSFQMGAGETMSFSVNYASRSTGVWSAESRGWDPLPLTIGATASINNETLEASHELLFYPNGFPR